MQDQVEGAISSPAPSDDLATFLSPRSVSEHVGASQVGTSPIPPFSLCSSDVSSLSVFAGPGPSRQILNDLSVLNLSNLSSDNVIISVPNPSALVLPSYYDDPAPPDSQIPIPENPPYNLRPLANRKGKGMAIGGLASNPMACGTRKLRGRKSNLSKAQLQAVVDIAYGKQLSIPRVLRAEPPPT